MVEMDFIEKNADEYWIKGAACFFRKNYTGALKAYSISRAFSLLREDYKSAQEAGSIIPLLARMVSDNIHCREEDIWLWNTFGEVYAEYIVKYENIKHGKKQNNLDDFLKQFASEMYLKYP